MLDVLNDHVMVPVVALSAYILPSSDPTNTVPLATAGDECTWSPAVKDHSSAPVAELSA